MKRLKENIDRLWNYICPIILGATFTIVILMDIMPICNIVTRRIWALLLVVINTIIFLKLIYLKLEETKSEPSEKKEEIKVYDSKHPDFPEWKTVEETKEIKDGSESLH